MQFGRGRCGFMAGFLVASLLFGGLTSAADIIQKDIRVSYLPLRYFFEGQEKFAPSDQQGFTLNGRTYVPLRFMAESLGKSVDYDPQTYGIYVGRRPSTPTAIWNGFREEGAVDLRQEFYQVGARTIRGDELPEAMLLSTLIPGPAESQNMDQATHYVKEFQIDFKYKALSGTLFVPDLYLGDVVKHKVGAIWAYDESGQLLHSSTLTTDESRLAFSVPTESIKSLRVHFLVFPNHGTRVGNELLSTQLGVSNLRLE